MMTQAMRNRRARRSRVARARMSAQKPDEGRLTALRTLLSEGLTHESTQGKDIVPLQQGWLREHFQTDDTDRLSKAQVETAIGWLRAARRQYRTETGFLAERMIERGELKQASKSTAVGDLLRSGHGTPYETKTGYEV